MAARHSLVEACPTLRNRLGLEAHEAVIDELEGCLELLLELEAYAGPASIEWPEGQTFGSTRLRRTSCGCGWLRSDWFSMDGTIALDEEQVLEMRFLLDRLDRAKGRLYPWGMAALSR